MAGRGDPPEGPTDGLPDGGEDEYGAVVFDETFVRAARLREYSAQERMHPHARAVRALPPAPPPYGRHGPGGAWVLILLTLLVALAFAMTVHFGLRRSDGPVAAAPGTEQPRITVIPLAPTGRVPGGTPAELLRRGPAAQHRAGAAGITLPGVRATRGFPEDDVLTALTVAKEFLVASSLNPAVLTGATERPVRILLNARQLDAFDRSTGHGLPAPVRTPAVASASASASGPASGPQPGIGSPDSRTAPAAGWLVRFDPAEVALADSAIRVRGTLDYTETAQGALEVSSRHTFTYALRPAPAADAGVTRTPAASRPGERAPDRSRASAAPASAFVVQRELRLRFDHEDIARHQTEIVSSRLRAGPHSCATDLSRRLRPLLAGETAAPGGPAATDPYGTGPGPAVALCGTLADSALPTPAPRSPATPSPSPPPG
ncbi:hypothetical protein AB0G74_25375 [Streptomyces sp. NPDC020875]|uniref:SCO2583 family membrane protein n=1 Tax=Streptomyces sp. NPDC020875 TaxID=3154898 RepID=UPI0034011EDB